MAEHRGSVQQGQILEQIQRCELHWETQHLAKGAILISFSVCVYVCLSVSVFVREREGAHYALDTPGEYLNTCQQA